MLRRDKVVLMRDSVDTVKYQPGDRAAARAHLGLAPDRFWLLAVAQARPEKRLERILHVAASAALGRKESILDGKTGAVIGLDDFVGFRQAVLRYVDNPEITKMHGKNARAQVDTAYNVVRQSKEFAAHIERFL
jgi:hypothetical protein